VTYGGLRPEHGFQRDHCIPLGLGGADDRSNVWLQPEDKARRKDKAEWQAIEAYCRGGITLEGGAVALGWPLPCRGRVLKLTQEWRALRERI
jgi:hypothetical protein